MASEFTSHAWNVRPKNASSEGIHSDESAQALGFRGGFVPGVTLYENLVVKLLEQDPGWLSQGRAELHFRRPVYDAEEVTFTIDAKTQEWRITAEGSTRPRAYGALRLHDEPPSVPAGQLTPQSGKRLGDPAQIGALMESVVEFPPDRVEAAARASGFPLADISRLVPPGLWTNPVDLLHSYFECPMTIHLSSKIWHRSPLREGEILYKRGQITGFEERSGNHIVHLNAELSTHGRLIAVVSHSSVFKLREGERGLSQPA